MNYKERYQKVGDYADFDQQLDLAYSGYIYFHNDIGQGCTRSKPSMTIQSVYAHQDAVIVHKENSQYRIYTPVVGEVFTFDAAKAHALLPRDIAEKVVHYQSTTPQRVLFKNKMNGSQMDTEVRLVWKWINYVEFT